jgi:starch phosphorylase
MPDVFCFEGMLNLTYLAMKMSRYINGVAKKHGEVSREMFTGHSIDSITNGVHASTWTCDEMKALFDKYIPDWKKDNYELRYVLNIPRDELRKAHLSAKQRLFDEIKKTTGVSMRTDCLTIGSARRATPYKRGDLFFHDIDRLKAIAEKHNGIQAVFAGKAHPRDEGGKHIIQRIHRMSKTLDHKISVVFLEDYDMDLARMIVSGVDVWLNTPEPPLEASGTSGMKAALNGVPSLSVLDGWWIEGHVEGITGWGIGEGPDGKPLDPDTNRDAKSLYDKLDKKLLPLYKDDYDGYLHVMRNSIALNGSFFNTQRMVQEYVLKAYYL